MTKLDNIEVRMNERWLVHGQDSVGGPTTHHDYAQCNVDVSVLLQAVREWSDYVRKGYVFNQSPESYLSGVVLALTEPK